MIRSEPLCRIALFVFLAMYAAALALLALGMYGQDRYPLSAVFLLPLGLPWKLLANLSTDPAPIWPVLAPLVNAGLIAVLCSRKRR